MAGFAEGLFVPFMDNASKFMQSQFSAPQSTVSLGLSLVFVVPLILVPILGLSLRPLSNLNKFIMIIITFTTILLTHLLLLIIKCHDVGCSNITYFPMILLGCCYSGFATLVLPYVPLLVKEKNLGTAFGIVESMANFAMSVFPMITGSIQSHNQPPSRGFDLSQIFFCCIAGFMLVISFILYFNLKRQ